MGNLCNETPKEENWIITIEDSFTDQANMKNLMNVKKFYSSDRKIQPTADLSPDTLREVALKNSYSMDLSTLQKAMLVPWNDFLSFKEKLIEALNLH